LGAELLQALNEIYWPLEDKLGSDDKWLSLGAWAFHQSLAEHVRKHELSDCFLDISDVSFSDFDRNMKENLADDSWSEVRGDYGAARH
jgi:hypothetical protein